MASREGLGCILRRMLCSGEEHGLVIFMKVPCGILLRCCENTTQTVRARSLRAALHLSFFFLSFHPFSVFHTVRLLTVHGAAFFSICIQPFSSTCLTWFFIFFIRQASLNPLGTKVCNRQNIDLPTANRGR